MKQIGFRQASAMHAERLLHDGPVKFPVRPEEFGEPREKALLCLVHILRRRIGRIRGHAEDAEHEFGDVALQEDAGGFPPAVFGRFRAQQLAQLQQLQEDQKEDRVEGPLVDETRHVERHPPTDPRSAVFSCFRCLFHAGGFSPTLSDSPFASAAEVPVPAVRLRTQFQH